MWSLPWLARYPLWRAGELARRANGADSPRHLILTIANHFEPGWDGTRQGLDWPSQMLRVEDWHKQARATGEVILDADGTPFRHTNFYPAEQYYKPMLEKLAQMQAEGLGEVEIHLHHGVDEPDTPASLKHALEDFRDILVEDHKCLSRLDDSGAPMYAFVHGNWALANSAGGRFCGVNSEMQILADTGCYADLTLPSIHSRAQVARINAIYECGYRLSEARPHRWGKNLRAGRRPQLPILITGPTVFDWRHCRPGRLIPRIEDGVLTSSYPLDMGRLLNWQSAGVSVTGRPEWLFVKLYCHGFFPSDDAATIGEPMRRFMGDVLETSERTGEFKIHFATAREAYNIAMAAVDGHKGEPGIYRDYQLRQIMQGPVTSLSGSGNLSNVAHDPLAQIAGISR